MLTSFLLEHFAVNFDVTFMGEHIDTLTTVFCKKLKMYFMQIGTLSPNKNLDLFNFEENNIRCFYHRLKDFYKAMGWDSLEGLAKGGNAVHKKQKMITLAQNMIEGSSFPKSQQKNYVGKNSKLNQPGNRK